MSGSLNFQDSELVLVLKRDSSKERYRKKGTLIALKLALAFLTKKAATISALLWGTPDTIFKHNLQESSNKKYKTPCP